MEQQLDRIEIRQVLAVNPDPSAHPRRILVIGVSDAEHPQLVVRFPEQLAESRAIFVDPNRTSTHSETGGKPFDFRLAADQRSPAHVWLAEFDVGSYPGLGYLACGRQANPLKVEAGYTNYVDPSKSKEIWVSAEFAQLPIAEGYDVGVLFIHGIGEQRSAVTLTQWSNAVQKWINHLFESATSYLAGRFELSDLDGWESSMRVRAEYWAVEAQYWDRRQFAQMVLAKAEEKRAEGDKSASCAPAQSDPQAQYARYVKKVQSRRELSPEESYGCTRIIRQNDEVIKASALAGRAAFVTASLLDPWRSFLEPASAELRIEAIESDGYLRISNWLLAEAHWAEAFRAPEFSKFARWCIGAGPITFCYYFGTLVRRSKRHYLSLAHALVILATFVALLEIALLALLLLSLVPSRKLRDLLAAVQRTLTGVLGDSYIFVTDDLQRRAILDRVRRDLRWVLARCRKVVVVAHSQGAAVAYDVLNETLESKSPKLHSVATLGSAFQTLRTIEKSLTQKSLTKKSLTNPTAVEAGWVAIIGAVLLFTGVWWIYTGGWITGSLMGAVGILALLFGGETAANQQSEDPYPVPLMGGHVYSKPWSDFYAAFDPVPFGPLAKEQGCAYEPRKIHNRDSVFTDHNSYWDNKEDFVGPLIRQIAAAANYPPIAQLLPDDAKVVQRASAARGSRVRFLRTARWVAGVCTIALLVTHWKTLTGILTWGFAWLLNKIGVQTAVSNSPDSSSWLEVLLLFAPAIWYLAVLLPIWKSWGDDELAAILRRERDATPTFWLALFITATIGVAHFSAYFAAWTHAIEFLVSWLFISAVVTLWLSKILKPSLTPSK